MESGTYLDIEGLWGRLLHLQKEAFPVLKGLFPSTRSHPWGYRRVDNSAYFTATLLHSLMRLEPLLNSQEKQKLEEMRTKACEGVEPFQNKQGLPRYNFWKTNPSGHFPNGKWFGKHERFRPPDDVDDSVMIYQMQKRSPEEALWLKEHIDSYSNGSKAKWVQNVPSVYRILRAYCTFFSKDMPLGFDACVITNVIYFNRAFGFAENFKEKDSVEFLVSMLRRKEHHRNPEVVSPYYPQTSIILYHLAKLMSRFSITALEDRVRQVIDDVYHLLGKTLLPVERIMLENAWMWLTSTLPAKTNTALENGTFYFFVLPLTQEYEGGFSEWLARQRWTHIRFHCEALELAFLLENQILRREIEKKNQK